MIDLLAASDLSTAAVDQLVAASLALFAECGFDARNAEAMSHLGAMLAEAMVSAETVDAVLGAIMGVDPADARGLEIAA